MRRSSVSASVALIILVAGALCSCSSTTSTSPNRHDRVSVGWQTYTYGKARISVPSNWAVEHNDTCPVESAPGTLSLGSPKRYSGCPHSDDQTNQVILSSVPAGEPPPSQCPTIKMNGLRVTVGPCGSSDADGAIYYYIPSLGVKAVGLTPGSGTVESRVLQRLLSRVLSTLRR